jgi:hypothetical protein
MEGHAEGTNLTRRGFIAGAGAVAAATAKSGANVALAANTPDAPAIGDAPALQLYGEDGLEGDAGIAEQYRQASKQEITDEQLAKIGMPHPYSAVSYEPIPGTDPIPPTEPPAAWDFEADAVVVGLGGGGGIRRRAPRPMTFPSSSSASPARVAGVALDPEIALHACPRMASNPSGGGFVSKELRLS